MAVGDQDHVQAALPLGNKPDTHFTGGWMGPKADLDGCGKCRPPPGFNPQTFQAVVTCNTDLVTPFLRELAHSNCVTIYTMS